MANMLPKMLIILLLASYISAFIDLEDVLDTQRRKQCNCDKHFWQMYLDFYHRTKQIVLLNLLPKNVTTGRWFINKFLKSSAKDFGHSLIVQNIEKLESEEEKPIRYINTFYSTGEKIVDNHREVDSFSEKPESRHIDYLMIVEDDEYLDNYLTGFPKYPFTETNSHIMILVMKTITEDWRNTIDSILRRLWSNYGVLNTVLKICSYKESALFIWNPFSRDNDTFGSIEEIGSKESLNQFIIGKKLNDFNGYPIRLTVFVRNPTALKKLPKIIKHKLKKYLNISSGFGGLDGMVLANLAIKLNFTAQIFPTSDRVDYGYQFDNGSFSGSLGDVMYYRTDMSLNGRFIMFYDTYDIDFTKWIIADRFCVIAPKALRIPQWLMIFQCFSTISWILILFFNVICGWFWYILKHYSRKKLNDKDKKNSGVCLANDWNIEMCLIMFSAPSIHLPSRHGERFFVATCLMFSIIIVGTFQGSLTTSFSTVSFYRDIDTLEQLDKSGLIIGTSSPHLGDIFGTNGSELMSSLASKFKVLKEPAILRTAYKRDVSCVERKADIKLMINTEYLRPDGTAMLHIVEECPRVYQLAYVVRRGWPLLKQINVAITYMVEAGLNKKWYDETVSAIIAHKRLSDSDDYKEELSALNLVDMQTAFYILWLGYVVCTGVFVLELFLMKSRLCLPKKWKWKNYVVKDRFSEKRIKGKKPYVISSSVKKFYN